MTSETLRPSHQIDQEHVGIKKMLEVLGAANTVDELIGLIADLRGHLNTHFAFEESETGMRSVVQDAAPERMNELEALFEEHATLNAELDAVESHARKCLELRDGFIERMRQHEARESDLLSAALYDDHGGNG